MEVPRQSEQLQNTLAASPHWFLVTARVQELHEMIDVWDDPANTGKHKIRGTFSFGVHGTIELGFDDIRDEPETENWPEPFALVPYHTAMALRLQGWTVFLMEDTPVDPHLYPQLKDTTHD